MKRALLAAALAACARQPAAETRPPEAQIAVAAALADATAQPPEARPRRVRHADLDWLAQRWPEQTRRVKLESLAPRLAHWVNDGAEVRAYLTLDERRCQPILLTRTQQGDALAALDGRILSDEQVTDGGAERSYVAADLGHWLHLESGGGSERFDGRQWVPVSGWGVGDGGNTVAVLSHVDREIARWEGIAVRFEASCDGPIEPLPCAAGGARPCDRCTGVALSVTEYRAGEQHGYGIARAIARSAVSCDEPCPNVSNDAIERVRASDAFGEAWVLLAEDARPKPTPTLYRSEARCRREAPK